MFQGTGALAFNAAFYLQSNPDVFQAIQNGTFQGSALDHFVQFGQFEGRDPNAFFDTEFYLANNTDVLVAIADPANPSVTSAFQHFVMFGADEGVVRAPSAALASFNPDTYLAANPDLQAAFGNLTGEAQDRALFAHFLEFGVNENRPGTGVTVDGGVPGQTIAFTDAVGETLTGTANNDTFTGVVGGSGATFQSGDAANGGAGTDRLVLTVADDANIVGTTLNSVEQVFVRSLDTSASVTTLDASSWTGVNQLWNDRSVTSGDVTFNGVTSEATLGLNGTKGDLTANFAAGAFESKDTLNVVTNSSAASIVATAAGTTFTGLSVTATGANILTSAVAAAATTVTVGGEGSLEITNALTAATTVDASANTGGVEVNLTGNTQNVTATGGAGDDVFNFGAGLTKTDVVNGGAGFDTVRVDLPGVSGISDISSADAAAPFNALKSIERVAFDGADGVTVTGATFTNATITNLEFNTTGEDIINVAGSARTYEFGTENDGNATFNMKAGATELNLTLLGDDDLNASVGVVDVNLAGSAPVGTVATINLESTGDFNPATLVGSGTPAAQGPNSVGSIDAVAGSTLNITGSADLDVGGSAARIVVDASEFTGDLTIEGSGIVTTGTTASNTAAFVASDVITLGSGEDTVQLDAASSGSFTVAGDVTVFAVDIINDFTAGVGGDVLDFAGADAGFTAITAALQGEINALSGATATLQNALDIAVESAGAGWTAFTFQGETYALYDAAQAATDGTDVYVATADAVVQLNGVTVADLTADNFA